MKETLGIIHINDETFETRQQNRRQMKVPKLSAIIIPPIYIDSIFLNALLMLVSKHSKIILLQLCLFIIDVIIRVWLDGEIVCNFSNLKKVTTVKDCTV